MKRVITLAAILTAPLALTGCGSQDFQDEAQKEQVYEAYVCNETLQASESRKSTYASEASTHVLSDPRRDKG